MAKEGLTPTSKQVATWTGLARLVGVMCDGSTILPLCIKNPCLLLIFPFLSNISFFSLFFLF